MKRGTRRRVADVGLGFQFAFGSVLVGLPCVLLSEVRQLPLFSRWWLVGAPVLGGLATPLVRGLLACVAEGRAACQACSRCSKASGARQREHAHAAERGNLTAMIIPHRMLSADALRGVIEAFVTREGTDYGAQEVALATKVVQILHQLNAGTAVLVYDEATDSCTIQPTNQLPGHP